MKRVVSIMLALVLLTLFAGPAFAEGVTVTLTENQLNKLTGQSPDEYVDINPTDDQWDIIKNVYPELKKKREIRVKPKFLFQAKKIRVVLKNNELIAVAP